MSLAVEDSEEFAGAAETGGSDPVEPTMADMDVAETGGVPGAICPIGTAQVTTVPGVVGSDANGTGANVVPGVPGWVTAENGLGPVSGAIKIVPGVVGRPIAVVPRVETCAKLALQPSSRIPAANSRRRACDCFLGMFLTCLRLMTHRNLAAFRQIHHRVEDDLITWLYAIVHLNFRTEVARNCDPL
jgi:hypothetical protein